MENDNSKNLKRPPVVVVMGHVDHGKTTLLDYIRKTAVAAKEAGGITQSIGAYEITHQSQTIAEETQKHAEKIQRNSAESNFMTLGSKITFIDTPGHEAFSDMRQRGVRLADIAILIVSAEEGVKSQTIEALKAIQEQKLPYIVAINKIDRPNANVDLVKQQLAEKEVLVEGYGGTVPWVAISAKTGAGVDELLELLLLTADLAELKGDTSAPATGLVLEAKLDAKSGNSAILIIKDGTLHLGGYLVIGHEANKIKALRNFRSEPTKSLTFSAPAIVVGLNSLPDVGESFITYTDRRAAESAANAGNVGPSDKGGRTLPATCKT